MMQVKFVRALYSALSFFFALSGLDKYRSQLSCKTSALIPRWTIWPNEIGSFCLLQETEGLWLIFFFFLQVFRVCSFFYLTYDSAKEICVPLSKNKTCWSCLYRFTVKTIAPRATHSPVIRSDTHFIFLSILKWKKWKVQQTSKFSQVFAKILRNKFCLLRCRFSD